MDDRDDIEMQVVPATAPVQPIQEDVEADEDANESSASPRVLPPCVPIGSSPSTHTDFLLTLRAFMPSHCFSSASLLGASPGEPAPLASKEPAPLPPAPHSDEVGGSVGHRRASTMMSLSLDNLIGSKGAGSNSGGSEDDEDDYEYEYDDYGQGEGFHDDGEGGFSFARERNALLVSDTVKAKSLWGKGRAIKANLALKMRTAHAAEEDASDLTGGKGGSGESVTVQRVLGAGARKNEQGSMTADVVSLFWQEKALAGLDFVQHLALLVQVGPVDSATMAWPYYFLQWVHWTLLFNLDVYGFVGPERTCRINSNGTVVSFWPCAPAYDFFTLPTALAIVVIVVLLVHGGLRLYIRRTGRAVGHKMRLLETATIWIGVAGYLPSALVLLPGLHCNYQALPLWIVDPVTGFISRGPYTPAACYEESRQWQVVLIAVAAVVFLGWFPFVLKSLIRSTLEYPITEVRKHEARVRLRELEYLLGLNTIWRDKHLQIMSSFTRPFVYYRPHDCALKVFVALICTLLKPHTVELATFLFVLFVGKACYSFLRPRYRCQSTNRLLTFLQMVNAANAFFLLFTARGVQNVIFVPSVMQFILLGINVIGIIYAVFMAWHCSFVAAHYARQPRGVCCRAVSVLFCCCDCYCVRAVSHCCLRGRGKAGNGKVADEDSRSGGHGSQSDTMVLLAACRWPVNSDTVADSVASFGAAVQALQQAVTMKRYVLSILPELTRVDIVSECVENLSNLLQEAIETDHPLRFTLQDHLQDMISVYNSRKPVSLLPNDELEASVMEARYRFSERDRQFSNVDPRYRRILLKMFAVAAFMNGRRFGYTMPQPKAVFGKRARGILLSSEQTPEEAAASAMASAAPASLVDDGPRPMEPMVGLASDGSPADHAGDAAQRRPSPMADGPPEDSPGERGSATGLLIDLSAPAPPLPMDHPPSPQAVHSLQRAATARGGGLNALNEEEEEGDKEGGGTSLSQQEVDEEAEEAREASLIDGTDKTKINREGLRLYKEGELRPSALHFRKALQLDEKYKEAHNGLAVTLIDLGRPAEGLAHAREALELDGMYKFAHKNCGTALLDLGDYDGAVKEFSAALKLQRGYKEAQKGLEKAKALKAAGSDGPARAKALGRTGLTALWWPGMYKEDTSLVVVLPKGNNKQTLVFEGDALAGFNTTEAARDAVASVAASGFEGGLGCDGAVLHYIKAIVKDEKYRNAHYGLGASLLRLCTQNVSEDDGSTPGIKLDDAALAGLNTRLPSAYGHTRERGLRMAACHLLEAIALEPKKGEAAQMALGKAYLALRLGPEAEAAFLNCLGEGKFQGRGLSAKDGLAKARAIIQEGKATTSSGRVPKVTSASVASVGRSASASMETAVGIDAKKDMAAGAKKPTSINKRECYRKGGVEFKAGRLDSAVAHYERAVELDGKYYEAANNLGFALRERKDFEQAKVAFESALAANPKYKQAHKNLGLVCLDLGMNAEAVSSFETALKLDPNMKDAKTGLKTAQAALK